MQVLIVDDHAVARDRIRLMLKDEQDIEIDEAATGKEAIQRALERRPNVVIMDIQMPEMNGIEATAEIKRLLPATKVIALTMHDEIEYRRAMFSAGANAYLVKEDLPDDLIRFIRQTTGGDVHEKQISSNH